jgi:hypothetical protein
VVVERRDHPGDPGSTREYDGEHQREETKERRSKKGTHEHANKLVARSSIRRRGRDATRSIAWGGRHSRSLKSRRVLWIETNTNLIWVYFD